MPLLRFVLPALIIYLVYRAVRKRVAGALGDKVRRSFEQHQSRMRPGGGGEQQVIDLCPKCGAYDQAGHRCANS